MSEPGENPSAPMPAEPAPSLSAPPPGIDYPVQFTASAGEYFRIWIVNVALSLITLGFYSAWAKVRKKRYLYTHIFVDGDNFDYRAKPIAILKGRLIATTFFAAYLLGGRISPILTIVFAILLVIVSPWLIIRSLAFNAHNSAYRGVRFRFIATYGELVGFLLGGNLLVAITVGLAYPWFKAQFASFFATHHGYGETQFGLKAPTRPFYWMYLKVWVIFAACFAVMMASAFVVYGSKELRPGQTNPFSLMIAVFFLLYLLAFTYLRVETSNIIWNGLTLGPVRFKSSLRFRDLAAIYVVNVIAVIFTVGLATPWAVVRTVRYRMEKLVVAAPPAFSFAAAQSPELGATGEEMAEMFDVDIGFGL